MTSIVERLKPYSELEEKKRAIVSLFSPLTFKEKKHIYLVNNKALKISVSGLIKKYVKFVDYDGIAKSIDIKMDLPIGTTKKAWTDKSDKACDTGNKAHYFGEDYTFNRDILPSTQFEKAIVAFWDSLPGHIVPVFTELKMYHLELMFGGTADIILYNTITEKFIIADYKTNEDIFKNFKGKKLKAPFLDLLESGFNKYQLQFSFYQILFEQTGLEVERRLLVWLKPDGTFDMYDTEDLTTELRKELEL